MTTTEDKIKVMHAFTNGESIQFRKAYSNDNWIDCEFAPTWDWNNLEYRVKTGVIYREYNQIEFMNACREHGPYLKKKVHKQNSYSTYVLAISIRGNWIDFSRTVDADGKSETETTFHSLLNDYVWQDGTACGIEIK